MDNNIKEIIYENKVTVVSVIENVGLAKSAFYAIMNGKSIPSLPNARKISKVLGKNLEEVFPIREE